MMRIKFYEKINEIFNNLDYYKKLFETDVVAFNNALMVSNSLVNLIDKQKDLSIREKNLINKLIGKYGLSNVLLEIDNLIGIINKNCYSNDMLIAILIELKEKIEKIYIAYIDEKLIMLLSMLIKKQTWNRCDKIINIVNKKDRINYYLGLDANLIYKLFEDVYFSKDDITEQEILLMIARGSSVHNSITSFVRDEIGIYNFHDLIFELVELLNSDGVINKVDKNFVPCLLKECDQILCDAQNIVRRRKRVNINQMTIINFE